MTPLLDLAENRCYSHMSYDKNIYDLECYGRSSHRLCASSFRAPRPRRPLPDAAFPLCDARSLPARPRVLGCRKRHRRNKRRGMRTAITRIKEIIQQ